MSKMKCTCPDCRELSDIEMVELTLDFNDAIQDNALTGVCGRAQLVAAVCNALKCIEVYEQRRLADPALAESDPVSWDAFMEEAKRIKVLVDQHIEPTLYISTIQ